MARAGARLNTLNDHCQTLLLCMISILAESSEQCQLVGLNACRSMFNSKYACALEQLNLLCSRQKDELASVMSPDCCAEQAMLSAAVHSGVASTKSTPQMASEVVKALMACELAVALQPSRRRAVCCLSSQQFGFGSASCTVESGVWPDASHILVGKHT